MSTTMTWKKGDRVRINGSWCVILEVKHYEDGVEVEVQEESK